MPGKSAIPNIQIIPPGLKIWSGPPVLTAHGCAMLERFTGKGYTYKLSTLLQEPWRISAEKPLSAAEFDAIKERIRPSSEALGPDYCVDIKRVRMCHVKSWRRF